MLKKQTCMDYIKSIDIYKKLPPNIKQTSNSGIISNLNIILVSIIVLSCIGWLIITEVQTFLAIEVISELFIDDSDEFEKVGCFFHTIDGYKLRCNIP